MLGSGWTAHQPFVMLPYVPMIVFGLILAVAMS